MSGSPDIILLLLQFKISSAVVTAMSLMTKMSLLCSTNNLLKMKLYLQCIAGFLGPNKVLQIISTIINLLSFLSLALKFLTDKINKLDKTISEVLPGLEFFAYLFCF